MGLFGGSFATGLATGLATSVGETISDDRVRREARLDKLRTFYETRQVQEQDRAKAEDDRTRKHLERLKNETGAGAAEVVALYKGLGGDNDRLDTHFNIVDQNKADGGTTFSYTDMLKNSGVDFSQYGNFTMQDALDNFRYEISDVDAKFTESPSFLTAIGLGLDKDTVNKSLTQGIQDIVPSVSRKDSGIAAMAVPEGFYKQTMQAQQTQLGLIVKKSEERVNVAFDEVQKINKRIADHLKNKDELSGEAYQLKAEELDNELKDATKIYEAEQDNNAMLKNQKLSGEEQVSLPLRVSSYDSAIRALNESIEFGGVGDTTSVVVADGDTYTDKDGKEYKPGDSIIGEDAIKYQAQKEYEYQYNLVENMLTDDNANFVERSAMNLMEIQGGVGRIPYSVYIDYLKNRKSNNAGDVPVTGSGGLGADGGTGSGVPGATGVTGVGVPDDAAVEAAKTALIVRNRLATTVTLPEDIINAGNITPKDEAKVIEGVIARGSAGLNEEEKAEFAEQVRSVYGALFNEARENVTPAGRRKLLQNAVTNFTLSDEASTATIAAIDEGRKNTQIRYATMRGGSRAPEKELDNVMTDVIEDKAEEALDKILKDDGYDPILIKRNSRPYYNELLGNLKTKYKQAVEKQRITAEEAEEEQQRRNTLG